jgi:hypothetical protein
MISLFNKDTYLTMENILEKRLEEGFKTEQLVDVSFLRGIGKSYKLAEIAKKYSLPVIVPLNSNKEYYKIVFNYGNVYTVSDVKKFKVYKGTDILIEEGVDKILMDNYCLNVKTGYYSNR